MIPSTINDFYYLSQIGGNFLGYGVRGMLSCIKPAANLSSDVIYWLLYSAANRHDKETCMMFLRDWDTGRIPCANISRFVPGNHWHTLDRKFNTYEAAKKYIELQGFVVGQILTHYAPKEGD